MLNMNTAPEASLSGLLHPAISVLFGTNPRADVPSAWHGHVPFAWWIVAAARPRLLVELGTHNGTSYAAFCETVMHERLDARCYAVDTWQGDEHAGFYGETVWEDFSRFHAQRYAGFSELLRTTFDDALDYFEDGSVDLLHIDGCHSYEAVLADFKNWRPKLSSRAVVLFHDTNVRERHFGVWRLWSELTRTYPGFEFLHGHGLGVLAVGEDAPPAVASLCALQDTESIGLFRGRFASAGMRCIRENEALLLARDLAARDTALHEAATREAALQTECAGLSGELATRTAALDTALVQEASLRADLGHVIEQAARQQQVFAEQASRQQQAVAEQQARFAERRALDQQTLRTARAAAFRILEDHSRRLAEAETRADREAAAARNAEHRLDLILASEFWRATAPLRSGVVFTRRFAHLQIERARLLQRALFRGNQQERRILLASLRRRLGRPTTDVVTGGTANAVAGPQKTAKASYAAWQLRFDTPDSLDVERLKAMQWDQPDVHVIVHISADAAHLAERTAVALQNAVGLRWMAHFTFDPGCAPGVIAGYRTVTQDDVRFHLDSGSIPDGTIVVLLEGGAIPRPHGAAVLVDALLRSPAAILAYSDEDCVRADGPPEQPWFKPSYSPLLAEQGLLFGRMVALRLDAKALNALMRRLAAPGATMDAVVRDIARSAGEHHIVHVPHVLFHDALPPSPPIALRLPSLPTPLPLTSILIPTRDGWHLLGPCLESLKMTDWPKDRLEIIVIDNGSTDLETLEGMAAAEAAGHIRILQDSRPFNWARLNNVAARAARGDLLVLLNNDTEVIEPTWLRKLAAYAMQPGAGAVGPKLLYPDGSVQHGGVVAGIQGVAAHVHVLLGAHDGGYHGLANVTHEIAAVTGACLAVSRTAYEEVGGLDEAFRVAFNDIMLCLNLHAAGRRNVYVGEALLKHHEGKTRGFDDTPEKIQLFRTEARQTWRRHAALLRNDPFYSPNLSLEAPYELAFAPRRRPAWRPAVAGGALKVMMLSSTHAQGHGVAVVINLQVRALLARGHEVVVAGLRSDRDFAYDGHGVIEVHDPRAAATLAVSLGVNVIVAHTPPYFSVARWTGAYPPVLAYDYGEPPPELFPDAAARRDALAEKAMSLAMSSRVLAISEAVGQESVLPPDRIVPLGNGHLGRWIPALDERRRSVRRERGWKDAYVVLNVCRFHAGERAYKGVDHYAHLRAALQVVDPPLAARSVFVLCGKGDRQDVEAMQAQGLHVIANVTDAEMADLYAAADLYANFSRWEGYNLGIGQALAMGLPVIASDVPAHRAFNVPVTNDLIEAVTLLIEAAERPAERRASVWEWEGPLDAFVAEIEALGEAGQPERREAVAFSGEAGNDFQLCPAFREDASRSA
jgi:GT2 family glycosyltransferase